MTKREKQERIISHLQILRTWCAVNPDYEKGLSIDDCHKAVEWLDDAFDLLKAQEPRTVLFISKVHEGALGNCPTCGADLMDYYNEEHCGRCAQAVKWE